MTALKTGLILHIPFLKWSSVQWLLTKSCERWPAYLHIRYWLITKLTAVSPSPKPTEISSSSSSSACLRAWRTTPSPNWRFPDFCLRACEYQKPFRALPRASCFLVNRGSVFCHIVWHIAVELWVIQDLKWLWDRTGLFCKTNVFRDTAVKILSRWTRLPC